MPLHKSPTRTPALLAAKRGNAQLSTNLRTWRGDEGSRLNRPQEGWHLREDVNFLTALANDPRNHLRLMAMAFAHSLAGRYLFCLQAVILANRNGTAHRDENWPRGFSVSVKKTNLSDDERSRNAIENKGPRNLNSCRTRLVIETKLFMSISGFVFLSN